MAPHRLPDNAYRQGLVTADAMRSLIGSVESAVEEAAAPRPSWGTMWSLTWRALSPRSPFALFPITSVVVGLVQAAMLVAHTDNHDHKLSGSPGWLSYFQGLLVFFMVSVNVWLGVYEQWLRYVEPSRRIRHVLRRLRMVEEQISWSASNYPHLHTPLAASLVLQWTIRDKKHINLPWALLVEKDVILLKPGQPSPGRCHSLDNPNVRLDRGDILHVRTHSKDEISPTPEFKRPAEPKLFVMDETPCIENIKAFLRPRDDRPPSILYKYSHLFFTQMLVHVLLPIFVVITMLWNLFRKMRSFSLYNVESSVSLFLSDPLAVSLPLLSLTFPFCWIVVSYLGLAWILCVYGSYRHVKLADDPFDDSMDVPKSKPRSEVPWRKLWRYFVSSALGNGEYLSRTENILHTLGSVTALCCTDKKGILCWPTPSPEKIFILKENPNKPADPQEERGENKRRESVRGRDNAVPEILNINYDHNNPTKVNFDDPKWSAYLSHLKPLGLSILLNTCNVSTEEKYTNFFNHLMCESMNVEDSHLNETDGGGCNSIDVLPIVTRGCICELAKKIGFGPKTTTQYSLSSQIQTFRHVRSDLDDRFARSLSLAKLKLPFPHMVSVMVQQRATGARQLISQGTADIILDSCTDFWTGNDLEPLSADLRKKILDFYQRASLSAYCTAFSYRPLIFPLPWRNCKEYLQLPIHSGQFYLQFMEQEPASTEAADTDVAEISTKNSHISMDTNKRTNTYGDDQSAKKKQEQYVKTQEDAMTCLELECNQTFLGMVQLQNQVVVDVVQLIDRLEKACIRFVHFSKENELRSRVFSEKMGLESGWNCHISLRSSEPTIPKTVSCFGEEVQRKKEASFSNNPASPESATQADDFRMRRGTMGSSLPDKLNRPMWFLDFPKWQETKGGWNTERKMSQDQCLLQEAGSEEDSGAQDEEDPEAESTKKLMSESTKAKTSVSFNDRKSRHVSVTSDSDPFEYDMSNRAQLPKGIENIRPHLQNMDNVPLLVSLFTDCTPETTTEMLKIMQEYGEVVCVMGSSANPKNMQMFLQSDASLAIEPRYPQLCQKVPVSVPPKSGPSPVAISQLLNSVASSLSFKMTDEVSIYHLILESRHYLLTLLSAMKFWVCCLITLSCLHLGSLFITLPLFMTVGQTLWMSLIFIPLLSLSLMGSRTDSNVMAISTGKNSIVLDGHAIRYAVWCYGFRFLPVVVLLVLAYALTIVDLINFCKPHHVHSSLLNVTGMDGITTEAIEVTSSLPEELLEDSYSDEERLETIGEIMDTIGSDSTVNLTAIISRQRQYALCRAEDEDRIPEKLIYTPQLLNFLFCFIYFSAISLTFISRHHQIWQRHISNNLLWLIMNSVLVVIQLAYFIVILLIEENEFYAPPHVWIIWICGIVVVFAINEAVKRQEIKVEVRRQKRERLEFGTKLGINSPF